MSPHPVVSTVESYRDVAFRAASIQQALKDARGKKSEEAIMVLTDHLADLTGRLDRLHPQVTACLSIPD